MLLHETHKIMQAGWVDGTGDTNPQRPCAKWQVSPIIKCRLKLFIAEVATAQQAPEQETMFILFWEASLFYVIGSALTLRRLKAL